MGLKFALRSDRRLSSRLENVETVGVQGNPTNDASGQGNCVNDIRENALTWRGLFCENEDDYGGQGREASEGVVLRDWSAFGSIEGN